MQQNHQQQLVAGSHTVSLIPAYVYYSQIADPFYYHTFSADGTPKFLSLKPLEPVLAFFRACLHRVQAWAIENNQKETYTISWLWRLNDLLWFARQRYGYWDEPVILVDLIRLCLTLWNVCCACEFGFTLMTDKNENIYPSEYMNHWNFFMQSGKSVRPAEAQTMNNTSKKCIENYFYSPLSDICLSHFPDGQWQLCFKNSSSFFSDFIRLLQQTSWIDQAYLCQHWSDIISSTLSQLQWTEYTLDLIQNHNGINNLYTQCVSSAIVYRRLKSDKSIKGVDTDTYEERRRTVKDNFRMSWKQLMNIASEQ